MSDEATGETRRHRLAVVLSHPTQYYSPWFRWIAASGCVSLRVFYLSDNGLRPSTDPNFLTAFAWDTDLASGYEWEVVPNEAVNPSTDHFWGLHNPALSSRLRSFAPDAILLFGYKFASHLRLVAWARLQGIPLVFRGDSHLLGRGSFPFRSRTALTLLYAQFAACTYVGVANRAYFEHFKVPSSRLFFAPHAVDTSLYHDNPDDARKGAELRRALGIPVKDRVVLFSGKFSELKRPGALLDAFLRLGAADAWLVMSGDGPEKSGLMQRVEKSRTQHVRFLPFANQSEMPARYALASVLAVPSRSETWGLSVNEAMHMGLPCLVSDRVGCQRDLVTEGETGWVYRADQPSGLEDALRRALACPDPALDRMRGAARHRVSGYTYEQATAGLLAAIRHALLR